MAASVEIARPTAVVLSQDRVTPGSCNIPVGEFPRSSNNATSTDPESVAAGIIKNLNEAVSKKDYRAVSNLFLENGYWRDHLCLTWDYHTVKGRDKISQFLQENHRLESVEIDKSSSFRAPHVGPIDAFGDVIGVEFFTKVTTDVGSGQGVVRLAERNGEWKIFTFFTSLKELKGHEERVRHHRPRGVQHGEHPGRQNWLERRIAEVEFKDKEPAVVVVGMFSSASRQGLWSVQLTSLCQVLVKPD